MKDSMGRIFSLLDSDRIEKSRQDRVAEHPGHEVENFTQLTDAVAKLNFYNQNLNLYFRGQTRDHRIQRRRENEKTVLLPWAFRKDHSPDKASSRRYVECTLPAMARELMKELKKLPSYRRRAQRIVMKGMRHFEETKWTILQHYGCPTPLLDVSASLRVACTFATTEEETDEPSSEGYVYVLGLPNIHGHISFFPHDGIVMVKLQAACPPEAKRPHYQQGYLVGSIPHTPQKYTYRYRDVALRLVAKFHIAEPDTFWQRTDYSPLLKRTLMPEEDPIADIVGTIRKRHVE